MGTYSGWAHKVDYVPRNIIDHLHITREEGERIMRQLRMTMHLFIFTIALVLLAQVQSMAAGQMDASELTYDIKAQSLKAALESYQKTSGINLAYSDDLVEEKISNGVHGTKTQAQALKKILKGTGLTYMVTNHGTVVLKENKTVVAQREAEEKKEAKRPVEIETMTVTAQKREENVQDVPASISVFSDIQLEDADIRDTFDLIHFSPNLHMQQNRLEHPVTIRGISSFNTSIYSPSGFYVDDVCYPLHYMQNPELFDIERAEILRGPQGTLYGRNSESGVINIITKKPDNEFRGKVFGEYGNYETSHGDSDSYRTGGSISGPIVRDKLYLGLSGQWEDSDGYMYNEFNDDDEVNDFEHANGRATLRWTPSDSWDISLIANVMDTDDHNAEYRWIDGPKKTHPFDVRYDSDGSSDQDGNVQALRIKYSGDSFNILSVSSLLDYRHYFQGDHDCWDDPINKGQSFAEYKDRQYSQELRVSSPQNSTPFEWLAGFYAFKEDTDIDFNIYSHTYGMSLFHPVADIETKSWAVFADGTYTLFEKLHLTAGLRFDSQDLEGDMKDNALGATFDKDQDFDEWLPKFSISYDLTDDVMVYASASKGYMVGGYNPYCSMNPTTQTFTYDEEKTWNYEAGIKTSWFNNKLMANLSIFYIDIKDKQVSEVVSNIVSITNAADAHSQGCEFEIQARPIRGLDIFAGFGYTEAEFDDFKATEWNDTYTALVENDYEDNDLQYAPNYTYNLSVQYRHESGFFGRADFLGTDNFYGDHANTAEADSYEIVNLRLGYESEHFDLILWGKNLFDEEYLTYVAPYGAYNVGVDGPPQTFGATITYRF